MLNPAKRVDSIELSQIRKMFEVTNENAINLGIGEPDFDIPENIQLAIKEAIDELAKLRSSTLEALRMRNP